MSTAEFSVTLPCKNSQIKLTYLTNKLSLLIHRHTNDAFLIAQFFKVVERRGRRHIIHCILRCSCGFIFLFDHVIVFEELRFVVNLNFNRSGVSLCYSGYEVQYVF